jgi:hypothetical protein
MLPYFKLWIIVVVAVLTLGTASSAWATPLCGISFTSTQGSVLYQVDPQTGQASDPKPTGLSHVVGIAFGPAGPLYGLTNATAPTNPNSLVRINRTTGSSQLVGPTGLNNIVEGDLSCDRTTGVLYGMYHLTSGERKLFTLNAATGAASTLPTSLSGDPSAMAFNAAGTLYVIDTALAKLLTVDKTTGDTLSSISLNRSLGSVAGMAVDPLTGTFYVADGDSGGTNHLYTLNPLTSVLTDIGPTGPPDGLGGLAFIPEPAALALLGLGAVVLRGRRGTP